MVMWSSSCEPNDELLVFDALLFAVIMGHMEGPVGGTGLFWT